MPNSGPEAHAPPVLDVSDISKTFGGARALDRVAFRVDAGRVHGLLGKNGSGKSTLVKILAGFHAPDPGGRLVFNGRPVPLPLQPGDFRTLGMSFVHQNLGLVPTLTVLENLRLAHLTSARSAFISWPGERAAAREALARFGLSLDPDERVDRITPVERALLAIVRAFEEVEAARRGTGEPGLVLLDEPTPFLPREGVEKLFRLIRSIARSGSSVVFISHDIEEVMQITDDITVLRDGVVAGRIETAAATHDRIVEMIVGRTLARMPHHVAAERAARPVRVEVRDLAGGMLRPTSFSAGVGEVIGLTGLIGSGYEEIPYLLFGARPCRSGEITLDGEVLPLAEMTPRKAIDRGFALLPGDRQGASGVGSLSVVDNMFLPNVASFFRSGRMRNGAMIRAARDLGAEYEVRPNDPLLKLSALSGGNAQKVLIARWMHCRPRLLLLDEPTQGVDVGTRQQIFAAIRAAAAGGMSAVCASSDPEQLAEICDRVIVFARGRASAELSGRAVTKDEIAEACYLSAGTSAAISAAEASGISG